MKKHVINKYVKSHLPLHDDGVPVRIGIDQFPVQPGNFNICGFPKSDVSLLLEISAKSGVNSSKFEQVASRLNAIREVDVNKGKTLEEIWMSWRPANLQSPSEVRQFEEWYLAQYPLGSTTSTADVPDEDKTEAKGNEPTS